MAVNRVLSIVSVNRVANRAVNRAVNLTHLTAPVCVAAFASGNGTTTSFSAEWQETILVFIVLLLLASFSFLPPMPCVPWRANIQLYRELFENGRSNVPHQVTVRLSFRLLFVIGLMTSQDTSWDVSL